MNIFRFTGNGCHIISVLMFLHVIFWKKNASCVSLKSQILHMMVFATRGLVIFIKFLNFYNLFMQGFYLSSTACIIYMITFVEPTKSAYSPLQDDFNIWKYAIIPSIFLTLIMSLDLDHFDVLKLLWTYSIIQDVTAMVPQLFIAHYNRRIQSEVKLAILFMGLFRCLNIINWIYLVYTESIYKHHWMIYICCVMQVAIYGDFFYHTGTTICSNYRSAGNEPSHIVSDGNELSDPLLLIEQNAEAEFSVVPSSFDAATVADDELNDDADPVEETKGIHDTYVV